MYRRLWLPWLYRTQYKYSTLYRPDCLCLCFTRRFWYVVLFNNCTSKVSASYRRNILYYSLVDLLRQGASARCVRNVSNVCIVGTYRFDVPARRHLRSCCMPTHQLHNAVRAQPELQLVGIHLCTLVCAAANGVQPGASELVPVPVC